MGKADQSGKREDNQNLFRMVEGKDGCDEKVERMYKTAVRNIAPYSGFYTIVFKGIWNGKII